jgi:tocopherol cyclase
MASFNQFLRTTLNPAMYHGYGKQPPFFEGWYFKLVNADETRRYAIIPGVFLGEDAHSFIQVLNGNTAESAYHRFDVTDFWSSKDLFEIRVGNNYFSADHLKLSLDGSPGKISGKIHFEELHPWPVSVLSPGIMGWYAWVPKMECYHGVLSLDHGLQGSLEIDGKNMDFFGGRGYIEKDWGQVFPEGYVWFQSNHFETVGTSITGSVAVIPWLGSAFRGFIIGLWHNQKLYRFATYSGAKIEHLSITDDQVVWSVRNRHFRLEMAAARAEGGLLHEPTGKEMLQRVEETMLATVKVRLSTLDGNVIFDETGRNAGMEVQGDLEKLLAMK